MRRANWPQKEREGREEMMLPQVDRGMEGGGARRSWRVMGCGWRSGHQGNCNAVTLRMIQVWMLKRESNLRNTIPGYVVQEWMHN